MSDPNDHRSEEISRQIEALILAAEDPKDKGFLLILNKIADSLDENTRLTRDLRTDLKAHTAAFQEHEKAEMALISQGRGFLRGVVLGLVLFQGAFAWYFKKHLEETERMVEDIQSLSEFRAEHRAHHSEERETYKAWLKGR